MGCCRDQFWVQSYFLFTFNDIVRCTEKVKFLLYADDTTIFIQGTNINELEGTLKNELLKISDCIKCNKLKLNITKMQYIKSHPFMSNTPQIDIAIDNQSLKQTDESNYLGTVIDSKLLWKSHMSSFL